MESKFYNFLKMKKKSYFFTTYYIQLITIEHTKQLYDYTPKASLAKRVLKHQMNHIHNCRCITT